MAADDALRKLRAAAQRRTEVEQEAERIRRDAVDDLIAAVRAAQDAGVPTAQIAREVGISRQRLYKLLERGDS